MCFFSETTKMHNVPLCIPSVFILLWKCSKFVFIFILYYVIKLLSVYPIIQNADTVVVNSLSPCDR